MRNETVPNRWILSVLVTLFFVPCLLYGGEQESNYYKNYVYHADGSRCNHTPPGASFTAFIRGDQDRILLENAPRWDSRMEPNITGTQGVFGVELGNFVSPAVQTGDSIHIRFTCSATGQQGVLGDTVASFNWPEHLTLSQVILPESPDNLQLEHKGENGTVLTWSDHPDYTYSIYRRTIQDTVFTGHSRNLYTRLAGGLTDNSYTDSDVADSLSYGYVVYAHNESGMISAHSREVRTVAGITNLRVERRTPTTLTLRWDEYSPPIGQLAGYNLYRKRPGEEFGEPVAYTGREPGYTDTRLDSGTEYIYEVGSRVNATSEFGISDSLAVFTLSARDGYYSYATLQAAVIIYQNTNDDYKIPDSEVEEIKQLLEYTREFYWRNSGMKLNIHWEYYPVKVKKTFQEQGVQAQTTAGHLAEMGVMNTQYDMIFRINPAQPKFYSIGAPYLNLPGPERRTGFCHIHWPKFSGVGYPGKFPSISIPPAIIWTAEHENQHVIDAVYRWNNHEEMPHGDKPWEFGPENRHGEHYDFQGKMFRFFQYYEDLLPQWGAIYESVDADEDGFPDDDPRVRLDEMRFGSSSMSGDTDQDGYSDKMEAVDGLYHYSVTNPNRKDTDGDSLPDGEDPYPRYPLETRIPEFSPVIDGQIEEGWPLINDTVSHATTEKGFSPQLYMSWDSDSLYLGMYLPDIGVPEIHFDFQANGRWWGRGNTEMRLNISEGSFSRLRTWDGSIDTRNLAESLGQKPNGMWDFKQEYTDHYKRQVWTPEMINLRINLNFPVVQLEMALPKNDFAGLTLQPGDTLGFLVDYDKVNNQPNEWATTFDKFSYGYVVLGGVVGTTEDEKPKHPDQFRLMQNYPNPFNAETVLRYSIPESGDVTLEIFDISGRKIQTTVRRWQEAGVHTVPWAGRNDAGIAVGSGIYICRLQMGQRIAQRKIILIR